MGVDETLESEEGRIDGGGDGAGRVAAIAALPRMLGKALDDIAAIASGMQVVPELLRTLAAIQVRTESLDEEVRQMRQAVESMRGEVRGLHPLIEELQNSIPLSGMRRRRGR